MMLPNIRFGFIAGCFDPFPHPGIIAAMKEAVDVHDLDGVWVGLHEDPSIERPSKHKPFLNVEERLVMVDALALVVGVTIYKTEEDLIDVIQNVQPAIRILGKDYIGKPFTGDRLNIPVCYAQRFPGWSSTDFIQRIKEG